MPWHVVEQGECLASIAKRFGFLPDTIWNDAENADLKAKRTGNVLLRGDAIFIPEKRARTVDVATEARHRFVRRGAAVTLRLTLRKRDGSPRANLRYTIEIDGRLFEGTTSGDGLLEHEIDAAAAEGTLVVHGERGAERYPLKLGHLNPADDPSGARARLKNLGYDPGPAGDGEALAATLRAFQSANELEPTGEPDAATRAKLTELHGS